MCQDEYNMRQMMSSTSQLTALEGLMKAFADRTRLRILGLLAAGDICVCHIHESLGIPQSTASRHLAYLRRAGLVEGRKDGLWVHYRLAQLDDPVLQTVFDAATHAVGHLSSSERDFRRLRTRVKLPATSRVVPLAPSCCEPGT